MSKKDPAALFYIAEWLTSTAEMDSDTRGWYLGLILHQFDKGDLPSDLEKLAVLAGVRFSEYERFKQVFKQVLEQKFEQIDGGRLINPQANKIIRARESFKDKRSKSGTVGYLVKLAMTLTGVTQRNIDAIKKHIYTLNSDQLEQAKDKQVLEQMLKLYINGNRNRNIDIKENNGVTAQPLIFEQPEPEVHPLQKHISENYPEVSKLKTQLTFQNSQLLCKSFSKQMIEDVLKDMENHKELTKKYTSVYLTVSQWCRRRKEKEPINKFTVQKEYGKDWTSLKQQ